MSYSIADPSVSALLDQQWSEDVALYGLTGAVDYDAYSQNDELIYSTISALAAIDFVSGLQITYSNTYIDADLKFVGVADLSGQADGAASFPGDISDSANASDYESHVYIETENSIASPGDISGDSEIGAVSYLDQVVLHETLHALGLAHPHDDANGSDDQVTPDPHFFVETAPLINSRYTVMSYKSGDYQDVELSSLKDSTYGFAATPMALDIAALQVAYGVDALANLGNTVYSLTDAGSVELDISGADGSVSIGQAFYCIWDAGDISGDDNDAISYDGGLNSVINLNAATLSVQSDYAIESIISDLVIYSALDDIPQAISVEYLGHQVSVGYQAANYYAGGFFSRLFDDNGNVQQGGYSIANGVHVEDAAGGAGDDLLIGNEGNNRMQGGFGENFIHGGAGYDTAEYIGGPIGLVVARISEEDPLMVEGFFVEDVLQGTAAPPLLLGGVETGPIFDKLLAVEQIATGDEDDVIFIRGFGAWTGTAETGSVVEIHSGGGDDHIEGSEASDSISAGEGSDWIYGHENASETVVAPQSGEFGSDTIDGGQGNDHIFGFEGSDYIYGGSDDDQIRGNGGRDSIFGGSGFDHIEGGFHEDTVLAGSGDDIVFGFEKSESPIDLEGSNLAEVFSSISNPLYNREWNDNTLSGEKGNDLLVGSGGNDILDGGSGDDIIFGDHGSDMMTGGSGSDTFVFFGQLTHSHDPSGRTTGQSAFGTYGNDAILDFESGVDTILLGMHQPQDPEYIRGSGYMIGDGVISAVSEQFSGYDTNGEKIWQWIYGEELRIDGNFSASDIQHGGLTYYSDPGLMIA